MQFYKAMIKLKYSQRYECSSICRKPVTYVNVVEKINIIYSKWVPTPFLARPPPGKYVPDNTSLKEHFKTPDAYIFAIVGMSNCIFSVMYVTRFEIFSLS